MMYHLLQFQILSQQVRHLRLLRKHLVLLSETLTVDNSLNGKYSPTSKSYCCLCKNENVLLRQRNRRRIWKKGFRSFHDGVDENVCTDVNDATDGNKGVDVNNVIDGDNGIDCNGTDGNIVKHKDGTDGKDSTDESNGTDGKNVKLMDGNNGTDGNDGIDKKEGTDGKDGNILNEKELDTSKIETNNESEFIEIDRTNKQLNNESSFTRMMTADNGKMPCNNIAQFLSDMELNYTPGYTGYFIVCPKFGKLAMRRKKEEDRLYVNSVSGYFYCRSCGTSGSWPQLQDNMNHIKAKKGNKRKTECFKNVLDVEKVPSGEKPVVLEHLDGAQDFRTVTDEVFETIQSLFEWHGIKKKTFIEYGVKLKKTDNEYSIIFPTHSPVNNVITSVSVLNGLITEDGDIRINPVQRYPKGKIVNLFGWQNRARMKRGTRQVVVITATEADAMAVSQETGILALSLTNASQLPQETLPSLEGFTKVILWMGTDTRAWDNSKVFARKLGDKRCYVFKPTQLESMPHEVIQNGESIKDILDSAKLISHKSIVKFSNVRQEVYSEFADFNQVQGVKWKRYTKLNYLLKGHRRGELTILTGPTGSGKTTFASEYSLDLCMQGVNTLWGSFEISNVRLIKMMIQQFSGKNMSKHLNEFDGIADEFSNLPLYFLAFHGEEQLKNVLEAMSHAVYIHDISHVIVDNLQFMIGMDFGEKCRFFKQDQAVAAFRNFATEKNCHVTLIIHPRKLDDMEELSTASIFGSAKVTQEADNILLIQDRRFTRAAGRKYVQVAKNRFDGELGIMQLTFNRENLTFSIKEKKNLKKGEIDEEETRKTGSD